MKNLLLFTLCFWSNYARQSALGTALKRNKQFTKLRPILLTKQAGAQVTLNCPVSPSVLRLYRLLRRTKSGKELDHARRQIGQLLGIKYKWYKDGKAIQHHRSAWFMKLRAVQVEDNGVYTCKVAMPAKHSKSQNFILKVFKQLKSGRSILKSRSKNITLRVGDSTTLRCESRNTVHQQQTSWLKLNTPNALNRLQNHAFTQKGIKTQILSSQGKEYKLIEPKTDAKSITTSVRARLRRGKKEKSYVFRLTLQNVQEKDSGVYLCLVRNRYGSDYQSFFVEVKSMKGLAPYPTRGKFSQSFIALPVFGTKKLRCDVTGDHPLTYQWYKNGKMILSHRGLSNSTTTTLRLRNIQKSDSGLYTCRVSNPYGVYEHNITLQVSQQIRSAPVLLKNYPKNITSSRGKTVEFKCIESIIFPMPDYRWYKWRSVPLTYPKLDFRNTSQFTEIDPVHYTAVQMKFGSNSRYGGKLTLTNITEGDAGLYSCVLRNQFGMDYASAFLHLKSNEGPKFVSTVNHPKSIEIPQTAPLRLECDAIGDPKPNISWFRNGKALVLTSGMVISNYTLTLNDLLPRHSGNYTCELKNRWGSIHHTFNVRIKEWLFARPIIVPSPLEILRIGHRYKLKCIIVSSEPIIPRMTRELESNTKGAENLTSKTKLVKLDKHVYVYSYVIRNATVNDSGIYSCVARNSIGESQKKFHIQVEA